jgi:hypothetical protein
VDPRWSNEAFWKTLLQHECETAVNRQAIPYAGPWNRGRLHEAWDGLDVDSVLSNLGYHPEPCRAQRPAFFGAQPHTRRGVVRSSLPPVAVKQEEEAATMKQEEEAAIMPPDLDPEEAFCLALEASMVEEDQKWDGLQEALQASAMVAQDQLPPPP